MYQLDKFQQAVVDSNLDKILVSASAGTGKTATIIAAAEECYHSGKTNIVLITFTNAAADEIKRRLTFTPSFVGTLHSFCIKLIEQMAAVNCFRPSILGPRQTRQLFEQLILSNPDYCGTRYDLNKCLNYVFNKVEYMEKYGNVPKWIIKIVKLYDEIKSKSGIFDLTDSPAYLKDKIKQYGIRLSYDAIFIDEAQDLTKEQFDTIELLPIKKKIYVGDERQSIYQWNGSDSKIFDYLKNLHYNEFELKYNYRSKEEILSFAKADVIATRGNGGAVINNLDSLLSLYPQILCRTNKEVDAISPYYENVSTIHAAKGLEYDSVLIIDFKELTPEEENIMFVAKTRAKENIGIFELDDVLDLVKHKRYGKGKVWK